MRLIWLSFIVQLGLHCWAIIHLPAQSNTQTEWQRAENQAFGLIHDYIYALNQMHSDISPKKIDSLFFVSSQAEIYNDIFPNTRVEKYIAQVYHQYVRLWFATENYRFEVDNLLLKKVYSLDNQCFAEVTLLKTFRLPAKSLKMQNDLLFKIRLPEPSQPFAKIWAIKFYQAEE
ncbi:MAG: hypothetical protein MUE85_13870 [Microscillaceae bacterium]|jgi:hypothetical protein|nr:hypothetical protein [Microscillaceae bacterium]